MPRKERNKSIRMRQQHRKTGKKYAEDRLLYIAWNPVRRIRYMQAQLAALPKLCLIFMEDIFNVFYCDYFFGIL